MKAIIVLGLILTHFVDARDQYSNFHSLTKHEQLQKDYNIQIVDKKNSVTVFAIHGGNIESATSNISRAIAKDRFNLYLFEGIKPTNNRSLHITSTQFDEPQLLSLIQRSKICISVHGHIRSDKRDICFGGLNKKLSNALFTELTKTDLLKQTTMSPDHCKGILAESPKNVVNLCEQKGVQLELSQPLRDYLIQNPTKLERFGSIIRSTIQKNLK